MYKNKVPTYRRKVVEIYEYTHLTYKNIKNILSYAVFA